MSIVEFLMVLRENRRLKGAFLIRLSVRPFLNSFLRAPSDSLMYAEVAIAPPRVLSAGYPGPIPFLRGVMNLPLKNFPSSTACGCNQSLSSTSACQNSLFFSPFFCHRQQLQKHERYARFLQRFTIRTRRSDFDLIIFRESHGTSPKRILREFFQSHCFYQSLNFWKINKNDFTVT